MGRVSYRGGKGGNPTPLGNFPPPPFTIGNFFKLTSLQFNSSVFLLKYLRLVQKEHWLISSLPKVGRQFPSHRPPGLHTGVGGGGVGGEEGRWNTRWYHDNLIAHILGQSMA